MYCVGVTSKKKIELHQLKDSVGLSNNGKSYFKADLHSAILSHAASCTTRLWHEKCCGILEDVLKPYDNRGLEGIVSVS